MCLTVSFEDLLFGQHRRGACWLFGKAGYGMWLFQTEILGCVTPVPVRLPVLTRITAQSKFARCLIPYQIWKLTEGNYDGTDWSKIA